MALSPPCPAATTQPLAKLLLKEIRFVCRSRARAEREARLREVDGIKDASINQLKLIAAAVGRRSPRARSSAASRFPPGTT